MLWPAFHFHSVLLIFVNLWPISTLCVADMVHAVADMVCGRYRCFPFCSVCVTDNGILPNLDDRSGASRLEIYHLILATL